MRRCVFLLVILAAFALDAPAHVRVDVLAAALSEDKDNLFAAIEALRIVLPSSLLAVATFAFALATRSYFLNDQFGAFGLTLGFVTWFTGFAFVVVVAGIAGFLPSYF